MENRLKQELQEMEATKIKNKNIADESERKFIESIKKKNKNKTNAVIYTLATIICFLIHPAFGVLIACVCIGEIFINFLKIED